METNYKPILVLYVEEKIKIIHLNDLIEYIKKSLPNYDVVILPTPTDTHCQVFFPTNETKEESFEVHKKIAQLATSRNIRVIL